VLGTVFLTTAWFGFPTRAERICISLFVQTVRLLESILILCRKGHDEEARILARSLVENTSYLIFILEKESEERAALYQHSLALSEFSAVNRLNDHAPEGEKKIDINFYSKNKNEAISYFRNKYGKDLTEKDIKSKHALRPQNAAEQLEGNIKEVFFSQYGIFYSPASAIAHGQAPLNFVEQKKDGMSLRKWSSGKTTKTCLQSAILFSLYSLEALAKLLNIKFRVNVQELIDKLFTIIENKMHC